MTGRKELGPNAAKWCRDQWAAFRELEAAKDANRWELDAMRRSIAAANGGQMVMPGFEQAAA